MSDATHPSLLQELKGGDFMRFYTIYDPFPRAKIRQLSQGDQIFRNEADCDDLVNEVSTQVWKAFKDGAFERRREGSFRCWLSCILEGCIRKLRRGRVETPGSDWVERLADPDSEAGRRFDRDSALKILEYLMEKIRPELAERDWLLFQDYRAGMKSGAIAVKHGLGAGLVYTAIGRVVAKLKARGEGLIDEAHLS